MDWIIKINNLKRNPVTVARKIDYVFKQLRGKVILSRMHPIGPFLNFVDEEFQNRGTGLIHDPVHIIDVKADKNEDIEVVEFIDKNITCALPDEKKIP